jgi:S-adenosylmethionine-diacylglycerol 3-amino-3-carboxypropyl transferase
MNRNTQKIIADSVYKSRPWSFNTLPDRLFARLFRGLVYPQIWEDPVCDMNALGLSTDDHIVCIASGGCNVMSYLTANPASVAVVDLSPWHVELCRLKLLAARELPGYKAFFDLFGNANTVENGNHFEEYLIPAMPAEAAAFWNKRMGFGQRKSMFSRGFYRFGALGRFIGIVHLVARMMRVDLQKLLISKNLEDQRVFFEEQIAPLYRSWFVKFMARRRFSLFGLGIPPAQYDKLAASSPDGVVSVLEERTRKLFCDFPITDNYFAWQAAARGYKPDGTGPLPPYLKRENFASLAAPAARVTVQNRSITDFLQDMPSDSKTVFVLLDAQDWMDDQQLNKLWQEITRTAAQGARVLFRTGGRDNILPGRVAPDHLAQWSYDAEASAKAFQEDRSAIYGGVHLYHRGD